MKGNVTFTISLDFWQILEMAAEERGITVKTFVAQALHRELTRPQREPWAERCAAVSASAQERQDTHELSVINGAQIMRAG